jgi:hypothetical protein
LRSRAIIAATIGTILLGTVIAGSARQTPVLRSVDEKVLREYTGVYRWRPNAFLYLQMWDEFSGFGKPTLVAFDESGEVRTLYPTDGDRFFAGPGIANPESSFNATRRALSPRLRGSVTALLYESRGASRSRNVKTSASRAAIFS